ncbi:hypothetical protein CLIB1423_25S01310 [[Candida] railenensis]|uniref:Uncharacterized protein n=1 Tax=[Candida] railenensis TaxID=45579 RepID=A0A9P0VZT5_9ASCO|nr:hypothetical protein CLIB1423_25S01310 [[Candida] railenensis]
MDPTYKCIKAHSNSSVNALALLENTGFMLTGGGNDGLIKLTHIDGEVLPFPKEHSGSINAVDYLDELIASGGENDSIVLWDLVKQCKLKKFRTDPSSILNNSVMDVNVHKDLLISCGTNCQLNFHDLKASNINKPIMILKDATDSLTSFNYCSSQYQVIAGSLDGKVYKYDLRNSQVYIEMIDGSHSSGILDVSVYKDKLLLTFENGVVKLVDREDMNTVNEIHRSDKILTYRMNSILMDDYHSATKKYIVSGSEIGEVGLWEINGKNSEVENHRKLRPDSIDPKNSNMQLLNIVKFLPSSNRLVSSSGDGRLHIWDNVV